MVKSRIGLRSFTSTQCYITCRNERKLVKEEVCTSVEIRVGKQSSGDAETGYLSEVGSGDAVELH